MKKAKKTNQPASGAPNITPAEFWAGKDGNDYLARNRVDWEQRMGFWQHILDVTNATSFLEVGVNAGWNFQCLRKLNKDATMTGVDLNEEALKEALAAGFDVEKMPGYKVSEFFGTDACELAFTSGVLIHVPPDDLRQTMTALRDVSSQYIMAVEYDNVDAQEITYRDRPGLLWKRPYGKLYEDMGLSLVESGEAAGFDQCHYWLLEKS